MKQNLIVCLLAWWFFYGKYEPQLFGPFINKVACETVKVKFKAWELPHVQRDIGECFWDDAIKITNPQ